MAIMAGLLTKHAQNLRKIWLQIPRSNYANPWIFPFDSKIKIPPVSPKCRPWYLEIPPAFRHSQVKFASPFPPNKSLPPRGSNKTRHAKKKKIDLNLRYLPYSTVLFLGPIWPSLLHLQTRRIISRVPFAFDP